MLSIGVDVSKEKLDIYYNGAHEQLNNDIKSLKKQFKNYPKDSRIVMEATGKYHRLAHETLEDMGFSVMVINPYQSRHFAKAMNLLCKTDKVDAKMLALFGEKMDFTPTPCMAKEQLNLQELSRYLDDLKKMKLELEFRKRESDGFIGRSLTTTLNTLKKQIDATVKQLKAAIQQQSVLQEKLELLLTIPGIGETTAITLLSYLRELGQVNKREIAALSGLAPVNNDSGTFKGKRKIKGGRHDVRSHLYMPILGATAKHNPRLKAFYEELVAKGKPKKVALTACMRKLIVWANAMLMNNECWEESYA